MSMFRDEIFEKGFEKYVKLLSPQVSHKIIKKFDERMVGNNSSKIIDYRWDAFQNVIRRIDGDVEENFHLAINKLELNVIKKIYLIHDKERDKRQLCLETNIQYLMPLIEKCWYPSEDLYIFDEDINWCVALTHHDLIVIARSI